MFGLPLVLAFQECVSLPSLFNAALLLGLHTFTLGVLSPTTAALSSWEACELCKNRHIMRWFLPLGTRILNKQEVCCFDGFGGGGRAWVFGWLFLWVFTEITSH